MRPYDNDCRERYLDFYRNWESSNNIEDRLFNYLFSEVYNDLLSKGITSLGDWLKYYSSDSNEFSDIVKLFNSYYNKILKSDFESVTFEEKVLGFNAFALYAIEMDIDFPNRDIKLQGSLMATLIEVGLNYSLYLKGYILLKGNPFISDRKTIQFYSEWNAGNVHKEMPITLF